MTDTTKQVVVPDMSTEKQAGALVMANADTIVVRCDADLGIARNALTSIKSSMDAIEEKLGPPIKTAHALHKQLTGLRGELLLPWQQAERKIKGCVSSYVEEVARAEAKRLQEEEQKARAERERQLKLAEDAKLEQALELAEQGKTAEADAALSEPTFTLDPVIPPAPPALAKPSVKGLGMTEVWSAEVTDLGALLAFVSANPMYHGLVAPNLSEINKLAKAFKEKFNIPGCRAQKSTSVSVRGG